MNNLVRLVLAGNPDAKRVCVVTPSGTEIPIDNAHDDWTVVELVRTASQIDELPELEGPRNP